MTKSLARLFLLSIARATAFPYDSIPVRLPDIDDGGELKNGNEQIESQLKVCP